VHSIYALIAGDRREARSGDHLVPMSNGSFGGRTSDCSRTAARQRLTR
jgi:hypothetical protein